MSKATASKKVPLEDIYEVAILLAKLMELDTLGANLDDAIEEAEDFLNRCKY